MITTSLGDFPLHIITEQDENYDPEPFSILVQVLKKEDKHTIYAICNNIPCELCSIQSECDNGKQLNQYFADHIRDIVPELFI